MKLRISRKYVTYCFNKDFKKIVFLKTKSKIKLKNILNDKRISIISVKNNHVYLTTDLEYKTKYNKK